MKKEQNLKHQFKKHAKAHMPPSAKKDIPASLLKQLSLQKKQKNFMLPAAVAMVCIILALKLFKTSTHTNIPMKTIVIEANTSIESTIANVSIDWEEEDDENFPIVDDLLLLLIDEV